MFLTEWLRIFSRRIRKARRWKLVLGVVLFFFVLILCFSFLSGPLFPWSPIKIGYDSEDFQRATVYFTDGTGCPDDCTFIDDIMEDVERFHGLKFKDRVKIIFCDSWGLFHRGRFHSLGMRQSGPLATAMGAGTVIYFSPGLKGSGRNLRNLLKHELSHCVRYQYTPLLNVPKYFGASGELHWLDECVAVYYGNASDYPDAKEFRKLAVEKGYLFRITDKAAAEKIPIKIRHMFRYAEYNFFFTYLLSKFGKDAVMDYVRKTMKEPQRSDELFKALFDVTFMNVVKDFEQAVLRGTWPPVKKREEYKK